jgi:hypothetical protein
MSEEKDDLEQRLGNEDPSPLQHISYNALASIISTDSRRIFVVGNKSINVIYATEAGKKAVEYSSLKELSIFSLYSKRMLKRILGAHQPANPNGMTELTLSKIRIMTHDKKELVVYKPTISIYKDFSIFIIENAKKEALRKQKAKIVLKAPVYLDYTGPDKLVKRAKQFLQDIVSAYSDRSENQIIELNLRKAKHIGESVVQSVFKNVLLDKYFELRNPSHQIYEQLIKQQIPAANITGYVPLPEAKGNEKAPEPAHYAAEDNIAPAPI